jgi:hypothetical protein
MLVRRWDRFTKIFTALTVTERDILILRVNINTLTDQEMRSIIILFSKANATDTTTVTIKVLKRSIRLRSMTLYRTLLLNRSIVQILGNSNYSQY